MRVLVTGSRNWIDKPGAWSDRQPGIVYGALSSLMESTAFYQKASDMTLVHGDCPGSPDMLADEAARQLGWNVEPHPADWKRYEKQAGFIRNQLMVDLGADICLAFIARCAKAYCTQLKPHFSHGAMHCAKQAEAADILVWWYEQ